MIGLAVFFGLLFGAAFCVFAYLLYLSNKTDTYLKQFEDKGEEFD